MSSDSETETEEMNFTAYSTYTEKKHIINVAGGGMMNGNAYANVEIILDNPNRIVLTKVSYRCVSCCSILIRPCGHYATIKIRRR